MVSDLVTKPLNSGNDEIDTAPIIEDGGRQHTSISAFFFGVPVR